MGKKKTVPCRVLTLLSSSFSMFPLSHTLQGLHSGSDKKYDALIIDEDKVRFLNLV